MKKQMPDSEGADVVIEMWADLACPWCYVSKHRLQGAIERRPDAGRFTVLIRSFQLDPDAPTEPETNEASYLRSHGGSAEQLLAAERQMQAFARREGLEYAIDRMVANTFDLHRVVQYAADQGLGFELFSTLQDGLFTGTLNPYQTDVLLGVAEGVGLDGQRVHEILDSDEYADRVRADRDEALELGASGVPFVVVGRRVAAPGALKPSGYDQLLEQAAGAVPSERAS